MNLNVASIYGAFGDKEELFLKAIDRYTAIYEKPTLALFDEAKTFRKGLELLLFRRIKSQLYRDHPGCLIATVLADATSLSRKFEEKLRSLVYELDDLLAARTHRAINDRELPADTDPKALARILQNFLIGCALRARAGESEQSLRALAKEMLDVVLLSRRRGLCRR